MVYYIAKLEEERGIPYIFVETFNPEKFYKLWNYSNQIYSSALIYAVKGGYTDIVKLLLSKMSYMLQDYIKYGIKVALEKGYTEISDLLKNYLV